MREEDEMAFETNVAFAKTMLLMEGELKPMVIGKTEERLYVTPMYYQNEEDKYALIAKIKKAFREMGVTSITFMSEAWYNTVGENEEWVRPSLTPDRKEALLITFRSKTDRKTAIYEIVRENDKVQLNEISVSHNDITTQDNLWDDMF